MVCASAADRRWPEHDRSRPTLEVADIFRSHGAAWRNANAGHVSLGQLKAMSAIERCRTVALGGHVARCENEACNLIHIAYNSCRDRHCPKCQGGTAVKWLEARKSELLPVPYYHVVFTLPAQIANIAYQNKRLIYNLLFKISAEAMRAIALNPKHLGAKIGFTSVLHTWGSSMMHHPHVHIIVPGGGLSPDGKKWMSCKANFFLHVKALSLLFSRLFCEQLLVAHKARQLHFYGEHQQLTDGKTFIKWLAPIGKLDWYVYAKPPFSGPETVFAYLSRYTHKVAISNRRLTKLEDGRVSFKYKDYRTQKDVQKGKVRQKIMTLDAQELPSR